MGRNTIVSDKFTRDMGYSEAEFFHTLPTGIGDYQYVRDGSEVTITHPERTHTLTLEVTALPDRAIALLRIPRVEVRFSFQDFSPADRDRFMEKFDQSFQRGGG